MENNLDYPEEIKSRVKAGAGFGSEIGAGWFDIIRELDIQLAVIYPDYVVNQIKEKFGGLRYYIGNVPKEKFDEIYALIRITEDKSYEICDVCGKAGKLSGRTWLATRCKEHVIPKNV